MSCLEVDNFMMALLVQLLRVSIWKTLVANFLYLKWKDAIKLPIVVCKGAKFHTTLGWVVFDCPIKFGLLRIGSLSARNVDSKYERTIIYNEGKIIVNGYIWIGVGCRVNIYKGAELYLGKNLKVTGRTTVICRKRIIIGDDCLFSWDIQIMDTDFHKVFDGNDCQINVDKEIVIGSHVWIGARSTVLKGSQIPANSVIAAGSLFSGKRERESCIYVGQGKDLSVVKERIKWSDM